MSENLFRDMLRKHFFPPIKTSLINKGVYVLNLTFYSMVRSQRKLYNHENYATQSDDFFVVLNLCTSVIHDHCYFCSEIVSFCCCLQLRRLFVKKWCNISQLQWVFNLIKLDLLVSSCTCYIRLMRIMLVICLTSCAN